MSDVIFSRKEPSKVVQHEHLKPCSLKEISDVSWVDILSAGEASAEQDPPMHEDTSCGMCLPVEPREYRWSACAVAPWRQFSPRRKKRAHPGHSSSRLTSQA